MPNITIDAIPGTTRSNEAWPQESVARYIAGERDQPGRSCTMSNRRKRSATFAIRKIVAERSG